MLNPDEIISEEEKVLSLKTLQNDLTISINNLKGEKETLETQVIEKREYLNNQDEKEVRALAQRINELNALIIEGQTALQGIQNKNSIATKEHTATLEKIKNASNQAIDIVASANMEALKIKEDARNTVGELSKEKNILRTVVEGLESKASNLKNEVIPELEKKEIGLKSTNSKLAVEIESNKGTLESLKKDIKDSEVVLSANKIKNDTLVSSSNRAERLIAQESTLETSVLGLTKTVETLTAEKASFEISKEERLAFDKDKYAIKQKEQELDQRISFIKGVYEDFKLPW